MLNIDQIDLPTLAVGLLTFILIIVLERTRLNLVAMLVALVAATALVPLAGWDSVTLVGDTASIPRSLPLLTLPDLALAPQLILPAIAIGIIGLVQAAGVSQGFPNPDGRFPDASGDFRGQGLANLIAGFFRGLPIGGRFRARRWWSTPGRGVAGLMFSPACSLPSGYCFSPV